jgi:hypothetical protein
VNIANALWTPAVVAAYKAANPVPVPPPEVVPPLIEQAAPVLVAPVETVVDAPAA